MTWAIITINCVEKPNGHEDMSQLSDFDFLPKKYLPSMQL